MARTGRLLHLPLELRKQQRSKWFYLHAAGACAPTCLTREGKVCQVSWVRGKAETSHLLHNKAALCRSAELLFEIKALKECDGFCCVITAIKWHFMISSKVQKQPRCLLKGIQWAVNCLSKCCCSYSDTCCSGLLCQSQDYCNVWLYFNILVWRSLKQNSCCLVKVTVRLLFSRKCCCRPSACW